MVGRHLPQAFRSHPRPSSALDAKASTVCPFSLDSERTLVFSLWSFQGARRTRACFHLNPVPDFSLAPASYQNRLAGRSLKTQQRGTFEVDVLLGELSIGRLTTAIYEPNAYRSNGSGIPRKEVIQPQLPLRLPCYDFTPITNPTFDGSLPEGLGHRLRVLPAFVV